MAATSGKHEAFGRYLDSLAELYVVAEEAGIDPRPEFKVVWCKAQKNTSRMIHKDTITVAGKTRALDYSFHSSGLRGVFIKHAVTERESYGKIQRF